MRMDRRVSPADWKRIGFGTGTAVVVLLAAAGAMAWMLSRERMDIQWIGYGAAAALVVSAFAGTMAAGNSIHGAFAVLGEWVVLLVLNGVLFGGNLEGIGAVLLALGGGCGAAVLLGSRRKKGQKRRKRRKNR